ncbi:MAG: hypothetical protein WD557_15530 [Dehalococcoidia bacterium]
MAVQTPTPADTDRMERQRAKIEADLEFWRGHYEELAQEYPEQFISVHADRVVASDTDLPRLWKKLEALGYGAGETAIEFMTEQPRFVLL